DIEAYEEAIELYQKIIKIDPENNTSWVDLADAYFELGQIDEALKTIVKGIETHPDSGLLKVRLVAFYLEIDKLPEATSQLVELLNMDKQLAKALITFYPAVLDYPSLLE